ncbi:cAMP-binding domain of CRP or a regulatory subunit of cAMP-dependent protein kinases [Aquimarina amphilecti]|uniref:cAMP-binding domain of CRP or a regulatory subunit of cAMP-dependent protein kinases n=1 Tax=Aquimarina amphilecti TaxID=1038014 RepID=A0A1H7QWM7_AQUAM|nr:Crp/Fnr family transcriptional regulator [Aquimarina amphilecti]SEL52289.1 cAMP-binding domain of CRP or a regulatory subunit of cAMP-dependent protein kinases [Aquimarina amphilecti]
MEKLKNCILSQVSIDKNALNNILSVFNPLEITKGEFFLESGKICRQMAFIESGFMRMYDIADGKEITLWIGSEGKFITSLSSFIFETNNNWNIQAITDCKLYTINRKNHFELNKTEPKWLEFDNLLLANSFALLEKNMFSQLHTTAKQRFNSLLNEEPELFKNVPLQYIASMLGITPESLSRLRKGN